MENRKDNNEYFMGIAEAVSQRATCLSRSVGAIIVKNKVIISTGYNGAAAGVDHCLSIGCLRDKMKVKSGQRHELCQAVHAEQNAIINAAVNGVSIRDSVLYCTTKPCYICAKMIVNAKIKEVHFRDDYNDDFTKKLFNKAGIGFYRFHKGKP